MGRMADRALLARASLLVIGCLSVGMAAAGCNRKPAEKKPEAVADAKPLVTSKAKPAVLVGSVRLADGSTELPSYEAQEMEHEVLKHARGGSLPAVCSPPKLDDRRPVSLTADGKLVGVMLAASEFSQHYERGEPKTWDIFIRDCRLQPKILVARIGDVLHVANESNFPMMPGLGHEAYNQTLTQGQSRDIKLDTGGVKILTCGFSGQCGRTDIIVLAHPYATVTDDKGEFRIENFPADETVRINAWHPLFFETYQEVRVAAGEEKRVEIVLTPRPPPKPPKALVRDPNIISPD
jgi:hypothetical protein